jgi:hypothetical protein
MAVSTPTPTTAFGNATSGLEITSGLRTLPFDSGHTSSATLDRALAGDLTYSP